MMARFARTMLVTALVLAALFGATRVASAGPVQDYRDAMQSFVPDIRAWASDTTTLVDAASAKPELACGEEMTELARQGIWIGQDMAGMASLAPSALRGSHDRAVAAIAKLTEAAQTSCGDEVAAARLAAQANGELRRALAPIQYMLGGPERPGETTDLPVSGN